MKINVFIRMWGLRSFNTQGAGFYTFARRENFELILALSICGHPGIVFLSFHLPFWMALHSFAFLPVAGGMGAQSRSGTRRNFIFFAHFLQPACRAKHAKKPFNMGFFEIPAPAAARAPGCGGIKKQKSIARGEGV
jgi:hypothetical protein